MRYHYEQPENWAEPCNGWTYKCDHPAYSECTLYEKGFRGLAVIQQRYDPETKRTWWGPIDPWLVEDIYRQPAFRVYFDDHAAGSVNGIFPTVTVRQVMWWLRMRPLDKPAWETVFDHTAI